VVGPVVGSAALSAGLRVTYVAGSEREAATVSGNAGRLGRKWSN